MKKSLVAAIVLTPLTVLAASSPPPSPPLGQGNGGAKLNADGSLLLDGASVSIDSAGLHITLADGVTAWLITPTSIGGVPADALTDDATGMPLVDDATGAYLENK